jgi:hypothetical protein
MVYQNAGNVPTMVEYKDRLLLAMKHAPAFAAVPERSRIQRLADALSLSYQAVKKVLDGKSAAFSAANNARAAAYLGADPTWLATGASSTPAPHYGRDDATHWGDVFADWRLKASPLSLEVIEGLSLLAQKNALREEDWLVIKTLMHRFGGGNGPHNSSS